MDERQEGEISPELELLSLHQSPCIANSKPQALVQPCVCPGPDVEPTAVLGNLVSPHPGELAGTSVQLPVSLFLPTALFKTC